MGRILAGLGRLADWHKLAAAEALVRLLPLLLLLCACCRWWSW
jgi:hypothetical protein